MISLDEVLSVNCDRLSESSQRYFEMTIVTRRGESYVFNNIERREFPILKKYFNDKKITVSSDEDVDGEDNNYVTKKTRKAPEMNIDDLELPEEEEDYNSAEDSSFEDEEESEESNEKKKKKK